MFSIFLWLGKTFLKILSGHFLLAVQLLCKTQNVLAMSMLVLSIL